MSITPRGMVSSSRKTSQRRSRRSSALSFTVASTGPLWPQVLRFEPHRDRARMGLERFGFTERYGRGPERRERLRVAFEDRGALHEVEHAETRGEPGRARGRQDMVRAADVVADRLGGKRPKEDRASIPDLVAQCLGALGHDLEM